MARDWLKNSDTNDAVEFLRSNVHVSEIEGTNLVEVWMVGTETTAKQNQQIVNAVVESYIETLASTSMQSNQAVVSLLSSELASREAKVIVLEQEATKLGSSPEANDLRTKLDVEQEICDKLMDRIASIRKEQRSSPRIAVLKSAQIRRVANTVSQD